MSLCENNCTYIGYDKDNKKAKCECKTKIEKIANLELDTRSKEIENDKMKNKINEGEWKNDNNLSRHKSLYKSSCFGFINSMPFVYL